MNFPKVIHSWTFVLLIVGRRSMFGSAVKNLKIVSGTLVGNNLPSPRVPRPSLHRRERSGHGQNRSAIACPELSFLSSPPNALCRYLMGGSRPDKFAHLNDLTPAPAPIHTARVSEFRVSTRESWMILPAVGFEGTDRVTGWTTESRKNALSLGPPMMRPRHHRMHISSDREVASPRSPRLKQKIGCSRRAHPGPARRPFDKSS
jgi:hypothetical protein